MTRIKLFYWLKWHTCTMLYVYRHQITCYNEAFRLDKKHVIPVLPLYWVGVVSVFMYLYSDLSFRVSYTCVNCNRDLTHVIWCNTWSEPANQGAARDSTLELSSKIYSPVLVCARCTCIWCSDINNVVINNVVINNVPSILSDYS